MNIKLTYLLICAAAFMCVASSCSAGSEDPEGGVEISFFPSVATRAEQGSEGTVLQGSFALFGDMIFRAGVVTKDPEKVFENREIVYRNNAWQYDQTEYWFPKHEHSFVAVHPYGVITSPLYENSELSFSFSLADDYKTTPDLLAATHRRYYGGDAASPVRLMFDHLLSLITVSVSFDDNIMTDEDYIEIRNIELAGYKSSATYNVLPAAMQSNNQTDDNVITMSDLAAEKAMTVDFASAVKVTNHRGYTEVISGSGAILMIPQTFTVDSDAKLVISYIISGNPIMKQATISLANQIWELGKCHHYKVRVSRAGASLESTISDWVVQNGSEINAY